MGPEDVNDLFWISYFNSFDEFPEEGTFGVYYYDMSQNISYCWTGTSYEQIFPLHGSDQEQTIHADTDGDHAVLRYFQPADHLEQIVQDYRESQEVAASLPIDGTITNDRIVRTDNFPNGRPYSEAMLYGQSIILTTSTAPEIFYEILHMWPVYDDTGRVIALYDTKQHRDEAEAQAIWTAKQSPDNPGRRESVLHTLLKNLPRKTG